MASDATKAWTKNANDEAAVAAGCWFDEAEADRVVSFFPRLLTHSKGRYAGKPFELAQWQQDDILKPLFGWKRLDGTRRFRIAYIEIPKKNGKSTLAAGVGLYLLIGDREPGAHIFSTACTRDQAGLVHGEAISMVRSSESLSAYIRVNKSTKEIFFDDTNSKYKACAGEGRGAEGLDAHGLIMDELHAWAGEHGRRFYESLRFAGRARRQPLQFIITTAGDDQDGICWERHQYAEKVASGEILDSRFFSYIRAAGPADDWNRPEIWRKANPSIGSIISEDEFAADLAEAKASPTSLAQFLRYSFNLWTTGGQPAIRVSDWRACKKELPDLKKKICFAALDLSRAQDMTAAAFVFPLAGESYAIKMLFWMPRDTIEAKDSPAFLRVWADAGIITATDGAVTDYARVEADMVAACKLYDVQELAFDPHFAEELTQRIADAAYIERVSFPQSAMNFAAPSAEFERLILGRLLQHDGNPCLHWQIGNLVWRVDANNNKRPDKSGRRKKIDGVVAGIMALGRAMTRTGEGQASCFVG